MTNLLSAIVEMIRILDCLSTATQSITKEVLTTVISGHCHLCGLFRPFSRAHVPPKGAFNKQSYLAVDSDVAWSVGPDEIPLGRTQQGGVWFPTLCGECNSLVGTRFDPEYIRWAYGALDVLNGFPEGEDFVRITVPDCDPLRIVKSVSAMFLALNSFEFSQTPTGKSLAQFVLDTEAIGLPTEIKLFCYLNGVGQFRYIPFMVKANTITGQIWMLSEIAFPPFGWVMTRSSEKPDHRLLDVSNFGDVPLGRRVNARLDLYRLPTFIGTIAADYRERDDFV